MKKELFSSIIKLLLLLVVTIASSSVYSQARKLRNSESIDIGNGQTFQALRCRGEGLKQECEVIYYVNKKKIGNSFWLPVARILEQEKAAKAKIQKNLPARKPEGAKVVGPVPKTASGKTPGADKELQRDRTAGAMEIKEKDTTKPKSFAAALETVTNAQLKKTNTLERRTQLPVEEPKVKILQDEDLSNRKLTPPTTLPASSIPSGNEVKKSLDAKKVGVFIDCNTGCDMNYIRTEVTIVDFLLDMKAADVHVLLNEQGTGGGGSSIQVIFYGQHQYKLVRDTIIVNVPPNTTEFERREEIVKGIKVGLLPFILKTAYAKYVDIKMKLTEKGTKKSLLSKDPWNYWVFRISADGTLNSDQVYKSTRISGQVSADRTTEKLKVSFSGKGNYNKNKYSYIDNGSTVLYEVLNQDFLFQHNMIASIGSHWGVGYKAAFSNSTFANNKSSLYGKTALEYSVFNYKDVNTRFITFSYGLDVRSNFYYDSTIYFITKEVLFGHMLQTDMSFVQKWGTISSTIAYRSFFKDPSLNNLFGEVNVNIRITGGLSMYFYTSASRVRDQVYLVKGKASQEDVLTRRRQLASEYELYNGAGLSFRFGSKLNNFVNPRMRNF